MDTRCSGNIIQYGQWNQLHSSPVVDGVATFTASTLPSIPRTSREHLPSSASILPSAISTVYYLWYTSMLWISKTSFQGWMKYPKNERNLYVTMSYLFICWILKGVSFRTGMPKVKKPLWYFTIVKWVPTLMATGYWSQCSYAAYLHIARKVTELVVT